MLTIDLWYHKIASPWSEQSILTSDTGIRTGGGGGGGGGGGYTLGNFTCAHLNRNYTDSALEHYYNACSLNSVVQFSVTWLSDVYWMSRLLFGVSQLNFAQQNDTIKSLKFIIAVYQSINVLRMHQNRSKKM